MKNKTSIGPFEYLGVLFTSIFGLLATAALLAWITSEFMLMIKPGDTMLSFYLYLGFFISILLPVLPEVIKHWENLRDSKINLQP